MIIVRKADALTSLSGRLHSENKKLGFVPTMGALHEGHISLIKKSKERNDITVCSIFVNPTQFNDSVDFDKYPRTIEKDILLLDQQKCDVLFLPSTEEIYPAGQQLQEEYALGFVETILEGRYRPGHFQGVCQVVERLLRIVRPDEMLLGQKDLQQIMVLQKMISLKNIDTKIVIGDIMRNAGGLALSSRNARLTEAQRQQATVIYRMLQFCRENLDKTSLENLSAFAQKELLQNGFEKIDYFSFHNARTLEPVEVWDGEEKLAALFAGYIGGVRLIDNMFMGAGGTA